MVNYGVTLIVVVFPDDLSPLCLSTTLFMSDVLTLLLRAAGAEAGCVGAEGTEQNPRGHQRTE